MIRPPRSPGRTQAISCAHGANPRAAVQHASRQRRAIRAASRSAVPAFGAGAAVVAFAVALHQALGQHLGLALGPAPAQQPGAPVEEARDVGIRPVLCNCALQGCPLRILRILRRPACFLASWPGFGFANACESLRIRVGLGVGAGQIRRNSQPFAGCRCRRRPAWMLTIRSFRSFRSGTPCNANRRDVAGQQLIQQGSAHDAAPPISASALPSATHTSPAASNADSAASRLSFDRTHAGPALTIAGSRISTRYIPI